MKKGGFETPNQIDGEIFYKKSESGHWEEGCWRAQKALLKAIPLIQKAHSKGVFHKNTSARKISRLTREINALKVASK